jgi:hypothetical protein
MPLSANRRNVACYVEPLRTARHPEQRAFALRRIWANRPMRRVLCDASYSNQGNCNPNQKLSSQPEIVIPSEVEGPCVSRHPEQRAFCVAKDLSEPRDASRTLRRNNRALGSLPYYSVASFSITTFKCAVTSLCNLTGIVNSPNVRSASCSCTLRRSTLKPFFSSASPMSLDVTEPKS